MIGVEQKYYEWLIAQVATTTQRDLYSELFEYLHDTVFAYVDSYDSNRAEDGVDLRYAFGEEKGIPAYIIESTINDLPCSMLEMMVALAIRIENYIMCDPDKGDRTSKWFWEMMRTMGLSSMAGKKFDIYRCEHIIELFNKRMYHKDGRGSLFTVQGSDADFRELGIWEQAMLYLTKIVKEEETSDA